MRRRRYLALTGLALVSGCTGDSNEGGAGDEPTESESPETETRMETATSTETSQETTSEGSGESEQNEADLATGTAEITEQSFEAHDGEVLSQRGIRAFVENTGDGSLSYVELTGKFHGADGELLESSLTNLSWLEPGETWKAWVSYPGDGEEDGAEDGSAEITDESSLGVSPHPDMELRDHSVEKGDYSVELVGEAENTSDSRLDYVAALGKFFDENGNVVSTGLTNVQNVDPGEVWEFSITYATTDPTGSETPAEYKILLTE